MNSLDFFNKNNINLNEDIKLEITKYSLTYKFKLIYYKNWTYLNIDKFAYDTNIITYEKIINALADNVLQNFNNKELRKKEILKKIKK